MFNACRRGPASLCRVLRAGSTLRLPATRPSTLSLISAKTAKPSIESRWLHVSAQLRQEAAAAQAARPFQGEITRFDQLLEHNLVHPNIVGEITRGMGLNTMTEVQSKTINETLVGTDVIAQARTGTGKTLGFLIPTIQNILNKNPELATRQRYSRARPSDIRAIIISPTRELAEQIAVEAEKLCAATDLRVQVAVGGNSKRSMLRKLQFEGCHVLVATPGRLNDLLTDPYSKVSAPSLNTLVLDEADRLLDSGFAKDIQDIIDLLPNRKEVDRQTLLFSATVPREVMYLVRDTLKPNFRFVQTVQEGELATHEKVPQKIVTVPGLENYLPAVLELAKREIANVEQARAEGREAKPFKAIVYLNSAANVELSAMIFEELRGEGGTFGKHPLYPAEILEMHSRLTQQRRTNVAERFRKLESAIMFSTDVTARGMHFPNVTHVIQLGVPPNQEQYVHRIGRTGRADQAGEGWIFICNHEVPEARRRLRGLKITPDDSLQASKLDMTREAKLPADTAATLEQLSKAVKMVDRDTKGKAFQACLGQASGPPMEHVDALIRWSKYGWGWPTPPPVARGLALKLGIARHPDLNIGNRSALGEFAPDSLNGPMRSREGRLDGPGTRGARDRTDGPHGDLRDRGFGGRDRGFGGRDHGFGGRDRGFRSRDRGFGGDGRRSRNFEKVFGSDRGSDSGSSSGRDFF